MADEIIKIQKEIEKIRRFGEDIEYDDLRKSEDFFVPSNLYPTRSTGAQGRFFLPLF